MPALGARGATESAAPASLRQDRFGVRVAAALAPPEGRRGGGPGRERAAAERGSHCPARRTQLPAAPRVPGERQPPTPALPPGPSRRSSSTAFKPRWPRSARDRPGHREPGGAGRETRRSGTRRPHGPSPRRGTTGLSHRHRRSDRPGWPGGQPEPSGPSHPATGTSCPGHPPPRPGTHP